MMVLYINSFMWFIVKLCACASKFLTASRWNWFKRALFSKSSPSKAFPYPLSHRSNDILIWVNIVDERCKPHFLPTYRWNRVKRASFSYSSTFNPFRHQQNKNERPGCVFAGGSNSGSKWCILVIRGCLNPRRWSKYWILTRVVILTDDRCHTDDKFFDTEKLFKISLKIYKVVEKMVVDARW